MPFILIRSSKTDELIPKILEYAEKQCPEDAVRDTWDDFYGLEIGFEENPYKISEN